MQEKALTLAWTKEFFRDKIDEIVERIVKIPDSEVVKVSVSLCSKDLMQCQLAFDLGLHSVVIAESLGVHVPFVCVSCFDSLSLS